MPRMEEHLGMKRMRENEEEWGTTLTGKENYNIGCGNAQEDEIY
jgi:hypothetical protein